MSSSKRQENTRYGGIPSIHEAETTAVLGQRDLHTEVQATQR